MRATRLAMWTILEKKLTGVLARIEISRIYFYMTPKKSRGWTFTLHLRNDVKAVSPALKKTLRTMEATWLKTQLEVSPTTGKTHLQGCVWFSTPRSLGGTKRRFGVGGRVHLEVARGTPKQNLIYCSKEESRAPAPYFWDLETGEMPQQGARVDILEVLEFSKHHTVAQLWDTYPTFMFQYAKRVKGYKADIVPKMKLPPITTVYYGPTGTGKSHTCMTKARGPDGTRSVYVMLTPTSTSATPWLDGYQGEEDVILEDFDGTIHYRILLRMLDKYEMPMQVKGGMVQWCPKRFWISSNKHPKFWYPTEKWEGGPLERRLVTAATGNIVELADKYVAPIDLEG